MDLPDISDLPPDRPVLIAGPTASGKSALALAIAEQAGGVIVNADALQVFSCWRVLTARPSARDAARAPHALYGHIPCDRPYSVGHWLRGLRPLVAGPERPIVVGGTGLYFSALTEGLAEIPATPPDLRAEADGRIAAGELGQLCAELDAETRARIDTANPMRVQRAWEVLRATGRGLAAWQDETPAPLLPLERTVPILVEAPRDWLDARIERRFAAMLEDGALDEARRMLPHWSPDLPGAKAIGAAELIAHLRGELALNEAAARATLATRRYAKRQRSWFRARMAGWLRHRPVSAGP
ncbi:MAG: tRNA (adenosine(37)-N6)-dimethylallyltransferase MiaA [Paracoccaceae bacterium]